MQFSIKKALLEKAMAQIDAIVPGRDTQTLLSNVLLSVDSNQQLRITASDMESTVRLTLPVEESSPGELIIKAKKLSDIARQISSEMIIFSAEEDNSEDETEQGETLYRVKVEGQGERSARFRMSAMERSHFPVMNEIAPDKLSAMPSSMLSEMINRTFYSISQEDNRYIYNGLCFHAHDKNLTLVGTDGRRLAAVTRELHEPMSFNERDIDIVVHAKAIRELLKVIGDGEEVLIGVEQRDIFFRVGYAELSSRLLEGKFPDYKRVIPSEDDVEIKFDIDRGEVHDAIRQVMVMTEQPSYQVRMNIDSEGVSLTANTPDVGEAEIRIPVKGIKGDLEIGFNANYFLDILKSLDCNTIELKLKDPARPIVFADINDPDFVALVMPMKI